MAKIGYARVSTHDQNLDLQIAALKEAGCERIFTEKASGAKADRPELAAALDYMREGDVLVVWRLDRLGRSMQHLIATVNGLRERGIGFTSIHESIDTTTSVGKLIFGIFSSLAEFERDLIVDRTRAGLVAAKERGSKAGRKAKLTPAQVKIAREQYAAEVSVQQIADLFGVSRATVYRELAKVAA